jgi:hypothetical protein
MSDTDHIRTILSQTLALIEQITTEPKPSYILDGQQVEWSVYLDRLRETADWCGRRLAADHPFEMSSRGGT